MRKFIPVIIYLTSITFFILGLIHPIMGTKLFLRIAREDVYLLGSVQTFFDQGEWFLGSIILVFTFILPIGKYIFLGLRLLGVVLPQQKAVSYGMEIINKWAMLDVFVVAVFILNLKFDSLIIVTSLKAGTTYFALSILLLMTCSFILSKQEDSSSKPLKFDGQ